MDLRCFIAVELSDDIRNVIDLHITRLRETRADIKWVQAKNLHLTLKFLGKTSDELIPEIQKRLCSIAGKHENFFLNLYGAGVFPNIKNPRVVWLGLQDSEEIVRIQRDIDESMAGLGFEKEGRGFSPHLTIGRVRSLKNIDMVIKELATLDKTDFGKIEVKNIALMKSELKQGGAEYFRLCEIKVGEIKPLE
ncbi:MAG: RNA 2',3'-cyclic phosphodiesterase [Nitrospirae bacterium]|nr:RNA 2',3'-cyclic phosphodiesterase [Nitrospirota bacterium]